MMKRFWRAGLALLAGFTVAACATLADHAPKLPFGGRDEAPASAPRQKLPPGAWPQSRSDVPADATIRFGDLPNGMRYAIRKQSIPPGQAALRLRIAAGSLMETDDQQGVAHFLEHMAFNGSKAVPEGDMIKILERLGLAFGADTNASTDFDETVYKLDLPKTNDETVDTSLMLLREAAGNLTLDAGAIERERGVVLSEERTRDTPAYRVFKARQAFMFQGQRPPLRLPIGQVEVLKTAGPETFRAFYDGYYRPERAVLVAVGDFDVDAMEAKIRAKFSDWSGTGPAGGDPDLGAVQPRKSEAKVVVEPGAPLTLQVAWMGPPEHHADTLAQRKRDMVEQLAFAVLNRRLSSLARGAQRPFLGAAAGKGDQYDAAEVASLYINAEPGRWQEALTTAEQEQRRAVEYGVRQDELDREIVEARALMKARLAGAATRRQTQLAAEILGSLPDDTVVTDPAQEMALFEEAVKDLKAETVSARLKTAFKGQGPLIFVSSPTPIAGGEATVLAALDESRKVAVAEPTAPAQTAWPYASFGTPGKVAETREVADMDAVMVRFENGVRLTVKPTRFRDDEVLIRVNVGGGLTDLAKDKQSPTWGSGAFIEGGLKQISAEDMERVLAKNLFGARFGVSDDAFILTGGTRPEDLEVQLQVLTAYLAEPGWRPEAFARMKASGKTIHDQFEATPNGVAGRDLAALMRSGDRRWTFPSREQIEGAKLEDLRDLVTPLMAKGSVEVVIVGDTTVEKATEAVARTFGALPPRPAPAVKTPAPLTFPAVGGEPVVLTHKGRADQALAFVAWPTQDFFADPQRARETAVMADIIQLRLLEEVREKQGATYSPGAGSSHSTVWPGFGYVSASIEAPPDKLPGFFADVDRIAADLAAKEVSADELQRAKAPRLERLEKGRVTNQYWLAELSGAQADPRRLDSIRALISGTERVTAADVRRAASAYLTPSKEWKLVVRSEKK